MCAGPAPPVFGRPPAAPAQAFHAGPSSASGLPPPLAVGHMLQSPSGFCVPPTPSGWAHHPGGLSWDPQALASLQTPTLQPPLVHDWCMDTGAETHMTSNSGNLSTSSPPSSSTPTSIVVGDGSILPVTCTGSTLFPSDRGYLRLNNVLVSPQLKTLFLCVSSPSTNVVLLNLTCMVFL